MIDAGAKRASRAARTIRKWLADFDVGGLRALAPLKRGRPSGSLGIDPRVETIVLEIIRGQLRGKPGVTTKR